MRIKKNSLLGLIVFLGLLACNEENKVSPVSKESIELDTVIELAEIPSEPEVGIDFIMGKFDPSKHEDFVQINELYTDKTEIYLQKETYEQFLEMHKAASEVGIELKILSATRPFNYQKGIWERKWTKLQDQGKTNEVEMALEILNYSSMPGTSRHHWGTDIDLNYLSNSWFEQGKGNDIYTWMQANASEYGFCQPYIEFGPKRNFGYQEEKWHWSYVPLANRYYRKAKTELKNHMIQGFLGAESVSKIQVVEKYVLGINTECIDF